MYLAYGQVSYRFLNVKRTGIELHINKKKRDPPHWGKLRLEMGLTLSLIETLNLESAH